MTTLIRIQIVVACAVFLFACDEKKFSSDGEAVKRKTESLDMFCDAGSQGSRAVADVSGLAGTESKVKGEFCTVQLEPPTPDPVTVMFVLDFSGSMRNADGELPCGRLNAINALLDKLSPRGFTPQNGTLLPPINVGVVTFGDDAETELRLMPVAQFRAIADDPGNIDDFCQSDEGYTNYQAAFDRAGQELSRVPSGQKLVYFISDGLPKSDRVSDAEMAQLGLQASERLRALPNLELYAVYLENPLDASATTTGIAPREYLTSIVGNDPSHLKVAQDANQLAGQIETLPTPDPTTIKTTSNITAVLSAPGFGERKVGVHIDDNPNANGAYKFVTDKFKLFYGDVGQTVVNTLRTTVEASDGSKPESIATINFTRTTN